MKRLLLYAVFILPTVGSAAQTGPCPEPEGRQFDFWIGQWDVVNRYLRDGAWVEAGVATDQVFPVLQGCAIVEQWSGNLGPNQIRGFSIRTYDPEEGKWKLLLSWPDPEKPDFFFLDGTFRHGRGEFFYDQTDAESVTTKTRYTFSDNTDTTMRWDLATSTDAGINWSTKWIMEFSRRDPLMDPPVLNAPAATLHRCTTGDMRALDHLYGLWETDGHRPRAPGTISLQTMPILDGCAQMDLMSIRQGNELFEAFIIRAFIPEEDAWKGYLLTTGTRDIIEMTGSIEGSNVVFSSEDGVVLAYRPSGPAAMSIELMNDTFPALEVGMGSLVKR